MKKIIAIILIISMFALLLYSCGGNNENSSDGKNNDADVDIKPDSGNLNDLNDDNSDDNTIVESEKHAPTLPNIDLKGETFMFYVMGYERNVNNYSMEIYAAEENGDTINDAVFKRNQYVEETYNFKVAEYPESQSDLAATVKKTLLAGEDNYQVFMMNLIQSNTLAQQGFLYDLNTVENIDLSQPWWDSKSHKDFTLLNKLYYAVGDINIMDNNATWAVFFNKKLLQDLSLDSPYKYVNDNEWTLDKYNEMCVAASKDLNGDGVMTPDDDQWGQVSDYLNTFMFYIGTGERATRKDANDIPYMDMLTERSASVIDKVLDFQLNNDVTVKAEEHSGKYGNVYSDMIRRNFKEDRALFYTAGLLSFTLLRDMESEFGMVPMPKYDSNQESYYTTYNLNNASALSIPITNQRLSETGLVVEALAAESLYTLTPAYYEVALQRKYMRDEESSAMLDIILSSRIFDLDMVYNWGGSYDVFNNLMSKKSRDFASEYEKVKDKADIAINKTVDNFGTVE
ncbi:MAG: extracellular solute-binding protein [Oscillospiraceae bacterium]|nr:extracellular solute-binding protein [Oscillospiraceae bacterium]